MTWINRLFRRWYRAVSPGAVLRARYEAFRDLLRQDHVCLGLIADLEEIVYGHDRADHARMAWLTDHLIRSAERLSARLLDMNPSAYPDLPGRVADLGRRAVAALGTSDADAGPPWFLPLSLAPDHPDLCGGKAAHLGRVAAETSLAVPPGFVITTRAFHRFLAAGELREALDRRLRHVLLSRPAELTAAAGDMMEAVLRTEVPEELARELTERAMTLAGPDGRMAVRSSAVAEDGALSFAGQYTSELDVPLSGVVEAYKRVVAGKYCPRALAYRLRHGLTDQETAMAVLVLPMIRARAAGVLYTRDPQGCPVEGQAEAMSLYAVAGLGESLVDGSRTPQRILLSRGPDARVLRACSQADASLLGEAATRSLHGAGLILERLFGRPQDVEWAVDGQGRPFILQTREFHMDEPPPARPGPLPGRPLAEGLERAAGGVGVGPVYFARTGAEMAEIPPGAVVVSASLPPALALFAPKAAAVVAETGSRASHFASIARENGLPVAVGPGLFAALRPGEVVTVDAFAGVVYPGRMDIPHPPKKEIRGRSPETSYVDLAGLTVKLGLTDPAAPEFRPSGCRSLHDVVRFCHEKGVAAMFSLVGRSGRGLGQSRRLSTVLPLAFHVLDLGGGLTPDAGETVEPAHVASVPLRAFWEGLTDPDVSWGNTFHVDWGEFDRVSAGIFDPTSRLLASYAVIATDYAHILVRFGYHFAVVDALCGPDSNANYVNFRFKGGGAGAGGRGLRLEFICHVLRHHGFELEVIGDMLDARFSRRNAESTRFALAEVGALAATTRLMDMGLRDMDQVRNLAEGHLERRSGQTTIRSNNDPA